MARRRHRHPTSTRAPQQPPSAADVPALAKPGEAISARSLDSFGNAVARLGLNNTNITGGSSYDYNPVTRNRAQLEIMYRGSWVVGKVVDAVAQDMFRTGVEFLGFKDDEIDALNASFRTLGLWAGMVEMEQWARLYGGALGIILIDGQDLSTPLNLDTVRKGQFKGIQTLDRWMLDTGEQVASRAIGEYGPDLGLPEFYRPTPGVSPLFSGKFIHHTRTIRRIGVKLPPYQSVTEGGWGMSVVERLIDRLIAYDSTTAGVAQLVYRAHLRIMKVDRLRELIASGGKALDGFKAQMDFIRAFQSNEGMTVIDAADDFEALSYNFGGLDSVLEQMGGQVAAAADIPQVRIFGKAPQGMNATGESDMSMYYDMINQRQENDWRRPLGTLIDLAFRSEFGRAPPEGWGFNFEPLWQMTDEERATIAKDTTATIVSAFSSGIVTSRATALKELRATADTTGLWGQITEEEIKEAEDEPPPVPDGHAVDETGDIVPRRKLDLEDQANASADNVVPFPKKVRDALPSDLAPLYVSRPLRTDLSGWARQNGIVLDDDLHVTVLYSKAPVDWFDLGTTFEGASVEIEGGPRRLAKFGTKLALQFASTSLQWRREQMIERGASTDFPTYRPHVSLCDWDPAWGETVPATMDAFEGDLKFGPERFREIKDLERSA